MLRKKGVLSLFVFTAGLFMALLTCPTQGQTTYLVKADSIKNANVDIADFNLQDLGTYDSLVVGIYAKGEIDLDSIWVDGGVTWNGYNYKKTSANNTTFFEAITGTGKTLTIDNAADVESLVQDVEHLTIIKTIGYNRLRFHIKAGPSGNTTTGAQKYILYVTVYKSVS